MTSAGATAAQAPAARRISVIETPATPEGVRAAVSEVAEVAATAAVPRDLVDNLGIVLSEALNNIVEHAFAGRAPASATIGISVQTTDGGLRLTIRDRGRPMPPALPGAEPPPIPDDIGALPEGGFGWFLIRQMCSEVGYRREGDENVLTLSLGPG